MCGRGSLEVGMWCGFNTVGVGVTVWGCYVIVNVDGILWGCELKLRFGVWM